MGQLVSVPSSSQVSTGVESVMQMLPRQTPVLEPIAAQSASQEQLLPGAARAPVVEDGSPEDDGVVEDASPEDDGLLEDGSPEDDGLLEDVSPEDDGLLEDVSPVTDSSSPQAVKPMKTRRQE